jgi:hypothetical protein
MAVDLNTAVPHSARIYDYLLGGKDNFAADRAAAAEIVKSSPSLPISMRANRNYLVRAARYMAADLGIRQFLDIGAGLPTSPNLHEVVQGVEPTAKVVYADNDPIVLVHARALLTSTPEGSTAYLDADLTDARTIIDAPEVRALDFSRPIAISLIAVLQFVTDEAQAHQIIDTLMAPLAPGSALALSTVTAHNEQAVQGAKAYTARGIPAKPRTDDEVAELFRGMEIVEPGIQLVHRWRPDADAVVVDDLHVQMSGGSEVMPDVPPVPPPWDPPPRRPRLTLTWIGLSLLVAALVTITVTVRSGLERGYSAGPAPCDRLDLSGITTELKQVEPQVTRSEEFEYTCQFLFGGPDGLPIASGNVRATYSDSAALAQAYDAVKDRPAGTTTELDALGDVARLTSRAEPTSLTCRLQLTVVDSNVRVELTLQLWADQAGAPCSRLGEFEQPVVTAARFYLAAL